VPYSIFVLSVLVIAPVFLNQEIYLLMSTINFRALLFIVQIVSLLHDVADHKYITEDSTLENKFSEFIKKITEENKIAVENTIYEHLFTKKMIVAIIERNSYSKQKKNGTSDWIPTLGYIGCFVRNIVSDADKLEAIGPAGIDRCASYIIESLNLKKIPATAQTVYKLVEEHYHEKLKTIAS